MERKSVERAAFEYNGRTSCSGCPFYPRLCTSRVREWCDSKVQKAFKAGAKWQKDKEK